MSKSDVRITPPARNWATVACASLGTLITLAACFPSFHYADDGSTPAPVPVDDDAGPPDDAGAADGADAATSLPVASIMNRVEIDSPTGNAQQVHLCYAENEDAWYFFSFVASSSLGVWRSKDFGTWEEVQNDTLPISLDVEHGNDGRNLAVACESRAGADVFHVAAALGNSSNTYVVRYYRISHTGDTWDQNGPHDVRSDVFGQLYDGPNIAVLENRKVAIATGRWESADGKMNTFISEAPPDDPNWSGNFNDPIHTYYTTRSVRARALVPFGSTLVDVWDKGDTVQETVGGVYVVRNGEMNSTSLSVFDNEIQGWNDWTVFKPDVTSLHLLRRSISGAYAHQVFSDGHLTLAAAPATTPSGPTGSGIVAMSNGNTALMFAVGPNGTIRYCRYDNAAWSEWRLLYSSAGTSPSHLSGSGALAADRAALVWSEGHAVKAIDVSALFR